MSSVYRLAFHLPPALVLHAQPGRHQPCLFGCVLVVDRHAGVAIEGPSRERVLDQAIRFLRIIAKPYIKGGGAALDIAAVLTTPGVVSRAAGERWPGGRGGRDGYRIGVGADVVIAPTSLELHLVELEATA